MHCARPRDYHWFGLTCIQFKLLIIKFGRFRDKNEVKSSDFNAAILTFSGKHYHQFSNVWMFGDMFPQSHCFATMPVTSRIKDTCSNLSLSNN